MSCFLYMLCLSCSLSGFTLLFSPFPFPFRRSGDTLTFI
jgi:hypothetical protein